MPKNKRKFIDKKNAVTFHLVHRSQRDPLITDETAPQRVLKEVDTKQPKKRKEEQMVYGIYFDDDYDYMQHLKPVDGKGDLIKIENSVPIEKKKGTKQIEFPSSIFPSAIEEKEGVLNKAAPRSGLQLDLDPDIVAAMDDDFDFSDPENELEDNFVDLANGIPDGTVEEYENEDGEYESDEGDLMETDEEGDEVASLEKFETKSRFTDYSMSSSVIRRNEQLTMLDDKFEEMFAQYDDNEIGALETEDIEGILDAESDLVLKYAEQFQKEMAPEPLVQEHIAAFSESDSSDSETSLVEVKPKPEWDCQSILSTHSNIYNHPKLISAPPSTRIRVNPKTGIPELRTKLTAKALASLNETNMKATGPGSLVSAVSTLSIRPKDETAEERKSRKKAFREHKKERRQERKLNSLAFKEEKKKMEKMMANNKSKFMVPI